VQAQLLKPQLPSKCFQPRCNLTRSLLAITVHSSPPREGRAAEELWSTTLLLYPVFLSPTLPLDVCLRPSFGRLDCESARPVIDALLPICLATTYHSETSSFRFKIKKSRSVIVFGYSPFLPAMFSASSLSCPFRSCTLLMNDLLSSAIDQEFLN
jgi:hypothetical protein